MDFEYKVEKLSSKEFHPLWMKSRSSVFGSDHSYSLWDTLPLDEVEKINELRKKLSNKIEICLVIFDENRALIAWSWGFQETSMSFYMANSAVIEEYRRQGLYTLLLDEMVKEASTAGFQLIYSRHCATNNSVLIPKLKYGFIISKMELDDIFGVLVHLHYYPNKTRRKIMDYRSGQLAPDEEIKSIFKKNNL